MLQHEAMQWRTTDCRKNHPLALECTKIDEIEEMLKAPV